ncbi:unnamed protein product [Parajaminaea phylloscopi]
MSKERDKSSPSILQDEKASSVIDTDAPGHLDNVAVLEKEQRIDVNDDSKAEAGGKWATQFNDKGEPIITTGHDVSRHLIICRDDGDPALTLRSWVLGLALNSLISVAAALFSIKPTGAGLSDIFNMLILYSAGSLWAKVLPVPENFDNVRLKRLCSFFNPSRTYGLKEHMVSLLLTSSVNLGGWTIDPLIVAKLFFDVKLSAAAVFCSVLSLSIVGLGLVGLLAPATVYPAEQVYWTSIPIVHAFQALHYAKEDNRRRLKVFSASLGLSFLWEIVPAYMMPWLNGISIPCLASMHAPLPTRKTIARLFGGTSPNQGLGFFSISLDPQYIDFATFAGYPLKWQIQYFGGAIMGAIFLIIAYNANVWNAKSLPFMTATLYNANGTVWSQGSIFDADFHLNATALAEQGLPRLTLGEGWSIMTNALALGALVLHVVLFLTREVLRDYKRCRDGKLDDPHWQMMQKYNPVPDWLWYSFLGLGIPLSFVSIYIGHTGVPWWGLIVALAFGTLMTPISLSIYGRYGSAVPTFMASKILAGLVHPDRPVANLWFAVFSHQVVEICGTIAGGLKVGQYLKVPPRTNVAAQMASCLASAFIRWWVLSGLIDVKRDILRDPDGDRNWYGGYYQDLNTQSIVWSMTSRLFSAKSGLHYEWIPLGLLIGAAIPVVHWLLTKCIRSVREAGPYIATPVWLYYLAQLSNGVNSAFLSSLLLAAFCQLWLRTKRPRLFIDFNYVAAAGIDGGGSIMIFVLSFAVFGASGTSHLFPTWFGNPALPVCPDHCIHPDAV